MRTKNQTPRSVHLPASVVGSEFLPACVRPEQMGAPPARTSAAFRESIRFRRPLSRAYRAGANQSVSAPEASERQSRRVRARRPQSSVLFRCARRGAYVSLPLQLSCLQFRESECAAAAALTRAITAAPADQRLIPAADSAS